MQVKDKCTQLDDINPKPKDFYSGALVIEDLKQAYSLNGTMAEEIAL